DRGGEAQHVIVREPGEANQQDEAGDPGKDDAGAHWKPLFPRRPEGRTMRMTMRSRKDTVRACSGPSASVPKLSRMPSRKPPAITPGMLPSPPSTQMTKALPR